MIVAQAIRNTLLIVALLALAGAAAAETNYVQIFVHPGSGTVCLDSQCQAGVGEIAGYGSVRFDGVTGGKDHTIKVYSTPGYEDYTVDIYMDFAGDTVTRSIYLDPVPAPSEPADGSLQLYVTPGFGQVCLDDKECEVSPGEVSSTWSVRFSDVEPGTPHTVSVDADGYMSFTTQAAVKPGQILTLDITLVPAPPTPEITETPESPRAPAAPQPTKAGLFPGLALIAALAIAAACGNRD